MAESRTEENSDTRAEGKRKNVLTTWWFWLIIVLLFCGMIAGLLDKERPVRVADEKVEAKDDLVLEDGWILDKSNQFVTYVDGYISNNTDKAIERYIQVTFTAYDKDGATVGTCIDNLNSLEAYGRWKFHALCYEKGVDDVKLKEIKHW